MEHPKDFPSVTLDSIRFLPSMPGIYFALSDQKVLYIGQSTNIQERWKKHHKYNELKSWKGVRIHFIPSDGRPLLDQEAEWISAFSPPLNTGRIRKSNLWHLPSHPPLVLFYVYLLLGGGSGLFGTWAYTHQLLDQFQMAAIISAIATGLFFGSWWTVNLIKQESYKETK